MKINYWKLAQTARLAFCALFLTLSVVGIVGIALGNTAHIVTTALSVAMTRAIAKYW